MEERRDKLAGLMGPIPLKYHMSDSGETEMEGENGWGEGLEKIEEKEEEKI